MEKESFTIEVKQEVSFLLVWIVVGILLVSGTYYFLVQPGATEIWPGLKVWSVASLFVIFQMLWIIRSPMRRLPGIVLSSVTILLLVLMNLNWSRSEEQSSYQRDHLFEVRSLMWRSMARAEMSDSLLATLESYYKDSKVSAQSIDHFFLNRYPGAVAGANFRIPLWRGDSLQIVVQTLSSDTVTLLATIPYVTGRDRSFHNFNGRTGAIQERTVLTRKGIDHVSEN